MKYFFCVFIIALVSCTSEENLNLQENSKFQGNYEGTFSGNLSGTVTFNVSNTGGLEGTTYYNMSNNPESLSGYVPISGKFDASTKSGLSFSGYLNDTSMNGKWTKGDLSGNYIFIKK